MLNVVGRSVPTEGRNRKGHRPGALRRRSPLSRHAPRPDDPHDLPVWPPERRPSRLRSHRLHRGGLPRHPRSERGRAHRRRPAVSGRARHSPRCGAGAPACARRPRGPARRSRSRWARAGEPIFDPETSPTAFKTILIEKGNLAAGFAAVDHIVEGTYRTGHQEHVYIEPQGVIAVPEDGGMTVYRLDPVPVLRPPGACHRLG